MNQESKTLEQELRLIAEKAKDKWVNASVVVESLETFIYSEISSFIRSRDNQIAREAAEKAWEAGNNYVLLTGLEEAKAEYLSQYDK